MTFAAFMSLPAVLRLALALLVVVGGSVLLTALLHDRIVAMALRTPEDDGAAAPPAPQDLAGRVLGLTGTAFVFLMAFTFGFFWGNAQDARSAVQDEWSAWTRAQVAASRLPAGAGRDEVLAALGAYATTVRDVEWPLLEGADADAAARVQLRAAAALAEPLAAAERAGMGTAPSWGALSSAVDDGLSAASDRLAQVPGPRAPASVALIGVLALLNLGLTAVYQPTRRRPQLLLVGLLAAITTLLVFLVVETSNPYVGSGAVSPPAVSTA